MTPEPITLRTDEIDGERKCYVLGGWPDCVEISVHLLSATPMVRINGAGEIELRVENGAATYKLAREQANDFAVRCVLCNGSFSAPPPSISAGDGQNG